METSITEATKALKEIQEVLKKYELTIELNSWERCYGMYQYFLTLSNKENETFIIVPKDNPDGYVEEIKGDVEVKLVCD